MEFFKLVETSDVIFNTAIPHGAGEFIRLKDGFREYEMLFDVYAGILFLVSSTRIRLLAFIVSAVNDSLWESFARYVKLFSQQNDSGNIVAVIFIISVVIFCSRFTSRCCVPVSSFLLHQCA